MREEEQRELLRLLYKGHLHWPWGSSISPPPLLFYTPHHGAKSRVLAGKWRAPTRSITGTSNGPANERARVTKPSLPLRPSCLPMPPPPSICIVSMGGAGLPRSWTAGHLQNGLYHPFVPTSGSLRLHIKAFFPPPGHLLGWGATAALEVLPAQPRSSNSVCSGIRAPGRRKWKQINRGRALSVREVERRVWKWGWMLPFASGFRKRCNSEYWSVWKSSVRQIT